MHNYSQLMALSRLAPSISYSAKYDIKIIMKPYNTKTYLKYKDLSQPGGFPCNQFYHIYINAHIPGDSPYTFATLHLHLR